MIVVVFHLDTALQNEIGNLYTLRYKRILFEPIRTELCLSLQFISEVPFHITFFSVFQSELDKSTTVLNNYTFHCKCSAKKGIRVVAVLAAVK